MILKKNFSGTGYSELQQSESEHFALLGAEGGGGGVSGGRLGVQASWLLQEIDTKK